MFFSPVFFLSIYINNASAETDNIIKFFPPGSKILGLSPEEVVINYWKTFIPIPISENPWKDLTGDKCTFGQNLNNASIFYLPTIGDGILTRTCTIPSGLAVVIPIIIGEASFAEFDVKTIEELDEIARIDANKMDNLKLSINNTQINEDVLKKYRIHTKAFDVSFPQDAIFQVNKSGLSKAVADGYYIVTEPLKKGNYKISFGGMIPYPDTIWDFDLTYNLIVK